MAIQQKIIDYVFVTVFVIIGFIMLIMASISYSDIAPNCTNGLIYDGTLVILILGLIFITMGGCYIYCIVSRKCYETEERDFSKFYLSVGFVISFGMMMLTGLMGVQLNKEPQCIYTDPETGKEYGKKLKFNIWFLFALSIVGCISSGFGFYYMSYVIPGYAKIVKKEEKVELSSTIRLREGLADLKRREEEAMKNVFMPTTTQDAVRQQEQRTLAAQQKVLEDLISEMTGLEAKVTAAAKEKATKEVATLAEQKEKLAVEIDALKKRMESEGKQKEQKEEKKSEQKPPLPPELTEEQKRSLAAWGRSVESLPESWVLDDAKPSSFVEPAGFTSKAKKRLARLARTEEEVKEAPEELRRKTVKVRRPRPISPVPIQPLISPPKSPEPTFADPLVRPDFVELNPEEAAMLTISPPPRRTNEDDEKVYEVVEEEEELPPLPAGVASKRQRNTVPESAIKPLVSFDTEEPRSGRKSEKKKKKDK